MSSNRFTARYGVDDGYVSGGRTHSFSVDAGDLDADMTEKELESLFYESMQDDFEQKVQPYPMNIDEFVAWAREQIEARGKQE